MSTMKRFFTICIAALLAAASFAQVNLWRTNGYLTQFEKATLDSITLTMADPYDEYNRYYDEYIDYYGIEYFSNDFYDITDDPAHLSVQAAYDYQKLLYVGYGYYRDRHNDFGFASVCMFLDSRGQDFIGPDDGYNWFSVWGDPAHWRDNTRTTLAGVANTTIWRTCYKTIGACNYVIATHTSGSEADQYEVAQAKAMRAFEYMQLAQAYQVAYSDNSLSLPCVPLVTDPLREYMVLAQPVATVAQVYAQIKKDLDDAISGLQGFVRADKSAINRAVAFGLRARYNLWTHHYEQAASDAEQALLLSGATPLTIAQASVPGFTSAEAQNVLWANIISESDKVVQSVYANWVSHMSTFYLDGYTNYAVPRSIASALYDEIPATDVRKGWWLDANGESPLLDAEGYSEVKDQLSFKNPYVNVKFGTGDGTGNGYGAAAADWIVMRAEELILLRAEALTRAGKNGAAVLKDFMKTYRDPSYDIDAHGLSVADEIWWQRRVELWGEGFAFGDLMRLHKGVVRTTSTNWPDAWAQDVPAGDERFPLVLPEKDPKYKVLAVWRNGVNNLYKSYYTTLSNVDSITLGEAREIDDVRIYDFGISSSGFIFTRSFKEGHMGELSDTLKLRFSRSHNIINPITVPLIIEADPVFAGTAFPESLSFEGGYWGVKYVGYIDTTVVVHLNELPVGTYQFTIAIPDEYCQGTLPYGSQTFTYQIIVNEPDEWDEAEIRTGVLVDQTVGPAFGIGVNAWFVEYQTVENPDGSWRLRMLNPYANYASGPADEDGVFDGNPWTEEGDVDTSKDYNFVLNISPDGEVTFPDLYTYLGIGWGDYTEQCFVDYARGRGVAGTYGRYEKENGKIVFDAQDNTMLFGAGGKIYGVQANFVFYLSKAAFLADQEEGGEAVDADVNTYVGNWKLQGRDLFTDAGAEAEVVIATNEDADGQYYTIEGIHPDVPVVYGVFNEEDHRLNIYPSRGTPVEKGGVTYTTTFYALNSGYSTSGSITIDFEPAEDGTLVLSEATEGVGFAVLYENQDDEEDYDFAMAWDQLQFAPSEAAGVPAKVAKRNAKQSIPARKATVKRPAKELVKKNIRLLNSNKEFQKNE